MTDNPQAETTLVEGPQTVTHNANELRRKLATAERIRENADFHLGQEMARRQLAEKETARLRAVVARLRQMTDHWEQQLPEVIRTPAVVSAIRAALEAADGPSLVADEAQQPETQAEVVHGCPADGSGITPCCGRTPFELARTDRMSTDPALVTCQPAAVSQPGKEA